MKLRIVLLNGLALLALAAPSLASAPGDDAVVHVDVRVSVAPRPGAVAVDRGSADGLAVGDRVVLHRDGGGSSWGVVTRLLDHVATVELQEQNLTLALGTAGEVVIPRSRLAPPAAKIAPAPKAPVPAPVPAQKKGTAPPTELAPKKVPAPKVEALPRPAAAQKQLPKATVAVPPAAEPTEEPDATPESDEPLAEPDADHAPWENQDDAFAPGMSLLAGFKPLKPGERAARMSGRFYLIGDLTGADTGGSSDSYARAGTEFVAENLFDDGGALHVSTEVNYRTESDGERGPDLLFRRLSYAWGGTRFDTTRLEVGRFLQFGMPEFGVLDGVEWTQRTGEGFRVGASAGYMPEPDDDFESFHDFQLAASFKWTSDDSEQLSLGAGIQSTLHQAQHDRDLLVANIDWLPRDGWDAHASVFVDFYGSGDDAKSSNVEVTQALASIGRRFEDRDGFDLSYRHLAFPDIDREGEFLLIGLPELEEAHLDRLALDGWTWLTGDRRLHGGVSAWNDEVEAGGSAELGIDLPDLLFEETRTDLTAFGTVGRFTKIAGVRVGCARFTDDGQWDVFYEIADHRMDDFASDSNDLLQQRVFVSRTLLLESGWNLTVNGEVRLWDEEFSWSVGFVVQKSF